MTRKEQQERFLALWRAATSTEKESIAIELFQEATEEERAAVIRLLEEAAR